MKKSTLFAPVLAAIAVIAIQRAGAASAVAHDFNGHTVYSKGQASKTVAIQHALETARSRGWKDAMIVAATDVTGYGAIAVARKGRGSVIGITLGRPSRAEAENRAMEKCLKGGGTEAKIIKEWYG